MTKAQEVYDRVEALVASGVKKADAFRQVAEEFGQPFDSMRGAYYAHTRSLGADRPRGRASARPSRSIRSSRPRSSSRRRSRPSTARSAPPRRAADDAKAEYEHLRDTAGERKAAIQAKIDALKA